MSTLVIPRESSSPTPCTVCQWTADDQYNPWFTVREEPDRNLSGDPSGGPLADLTRRRRNLLSWGVEGVDAVLPSQRPNARFTVL